MSLRYKFYAFAIGFAAVLLTSILVYLYISGRHQIHDMGVREVESYHRLLSEHLSNSVRDCQYELQGLQAQLDPRRLSDPLIPSSIKPIEDFVIGYAHKYGDVVLFHATRRQGLRVLPVKVFGGDTHAKIESVNENQWSPLVNRPMERDRQLLGPDQSSGGRYIRLSLPPP